MSLKLQLRGFQLLRASAAMALTLAVAGCHKKARVAYVPPPPPVANTGHASAPRAVPPIVTQGTDRSATTPKPATPAPAGQPNLPHGKPVSTEVGLASWYGPPYHNRKAADGTIYDQNAMTAAHRTLPMGSVVRVTNLSNNESVVVRINDRGPFVGSRVIDLSLAAAKAIDVYRAGVAKVRVEAYAPTDHVPDGGRWCVQIGAFHDEADAIQLKNDLMRRYKTAKVIEFAGPTGHWVRINPLNPDRATSEQVSNSIHIPDPAALPYVVRLN